MITLEEIIISRGDLEKIYRSDIDLTLWRAVNRAESEKVINPLYPDLEERILPNGRVRLADVTTFVKNGITHVKSEESRGTSLSDIDGLFGHKNWEYVVIPAGTIVPKELVITKDHYIPKKESWHYSISPNFDMPVSKFLQALDKLALNANINIKVSYAKS
ncbi:hypothetical protein Q3O60_03625 [Alkalimonas collagenimarina]|uniref:Tse2 ADP-ribosyltransferase toxin domain-containing protein n=1 Tax=Alkalimonas collagenimarina TaxID=400390 RepID=A0ABT9GW36_9GAMM|nr:hypothetical protein [Alkalimonas collagenimarina]MDP4535277.1 hypothetical protein [Alkalimonas collagenimarina]